MSEQVTLGKIITDPTPARDAVHVAVFPAVCNTELDGGDTIRVTGERRDSLYVVEWVEFNHPQAHGIVDPFLFGPIAGGTPFYGCLKPGTVTNLRHYYSHPAFAATPPAPREGRP